MSLTSYVKRLFVNNTTPAINATNLNAMDTAIYAHDQAFPVSIANGGTGGTTASGALSNLGALPISGGTLTGLLTLSGVPTSNLMAATKAYVDGRAQISIGSYTGTGTFGIGSPNVITLGFTPKTIIWLRNTFTDTGRYPTGIGIAINSQSSAISLYSATSAVPSSSPYLDYFSTFTWNSTGASWYDSSVERQANISGTVYSYIALG